MPDIRIPNATNKIVSDVCQPAPSHETKVSLSNLVVEGAKDLACKVAKSLPQTGEVAESQALLLANVSTTPIGGIASTAIGMAGILAQRASPMLQRFAGSFDRLLQKGEEILIFRGVSAREGFSRVGTYWSTDPAKAIRHVEYPGGKLFVSRINQTQLERLRAVEDAGATGVYQNYMFVRADPPAIQSVSPEAFLKLKEAATGIGKVTQLEARTILGIFD